VTGQAGVWIPAGERDFYLFQNVKWFWRPPYLLFNGHWCSFLLVKTQEQEVKNLPTSCTEVKNDWSIPYAPHMPSWYGQEQPQYLTHEIQCPLQSSNVHYNIHNSPPLTRTK
jgi:hypothetical protein